MVNNKMHAYLSNLVRNLPSDWLNLTTHRLDIYNESQAKTQFLQQFVKLYEDAKAGKDELANLPTAYDYIRLGHPLSCVLEWAIAQINATEAKNVICFSSQTIAVLAILRANLLANKKTQLNYVGSLPASFDEKVLKDIYGYELQLKQVEELSDVSTFDGSTIFLQSTVNVGEFSVSPHVDFFVNMNEDLGSVVLVNGTENESYVSGIQHVRRRETIAMTPADCLTAIHGLIGDEVETASSEVGEHKSAVTNIIKQITGTENKVLVGSSGLSVQYAIMMGLVNDAYEKHRDKEIKIVVPTNCYGGTNDQARRVAACIEKAEVVDLAVDGDNDMVSSIDKVLTEIAAEDAIAYIIAEIPTNPRVEVPDLEALQLALNKDRRDSSGEVAAKPVFILDQTFCPNLQFLVEDGIFSSIEAISYASGSKFPSGGKCTAGYCVGNRNASSLLNKIELHLGICDNEATDLQYKILATQLPSMIQRIDDAYVNTRKFVNYIGDILPAAKINFVSEELASRGFTPSVFSLDLPTKGNTAEERESYKRELNLKLIHRMINEIPTESKFCVSYGQLKGCYWTVPATSTQGTTKEGDKDYIVRASLSGDMDLDKHKKVFADFVAENWYNI